MCSTSGENEFWCIPGGKLEFGESLEDGLSRELVEELGVKPKIGNLLATQQYADGDNEFLEFFFEVTNSNDYTNVDLSKTSHGLDEIVEFDFVIPSDKSRHILPKFIADYPDINMMNSYL